LTTTCVAHCPTFCPLLAMRPCLLTTSSPNPFLFLFFFSDVVLPFVHGGRCNWECFVCEPQHLYLPKLLSAGQGPAPWLFFF
jgi:hypothetical protein